MISLKVGILSTYLISITIGYLEHVQGDELQSLFYSVNSTKKKVDCFEWLDHNPDPSYSCSYAISNRSRDKFAKLVNKHHDIIHFKLNIAEGTQIGATRCVIVPDHWIWTSVPQLYLKLPVGYGVWSTGTLSVSVAGPIKIDITPYGKCDLVIGEQNSTIQLARAFTNLGEAISKHSSPSYFCYNERVYIHSHFVYMLCLHVVCPVEALGYRCCRYVPGRPGGVKCLSSQLHYEFWWWLCPFLLGMTLFAFVPLLLMSQAEKIYRHIHCRKKTIISEIEEKSPLLTSRTTDYSSMNNDTVTKTPLEPISSSFCTLARNETLILETNVRPVTLMSIIALQIMKCFSFKTLLLSRVVRALFPVISLSLVALNTTLLYAFHKEFIVAAVKKGVPMGFLAIIAGFKESSNNFLPYLGGPYVAYITYITGGAVLISLPKDFSNFLQEALPDNRDISTSVLALDQATIQKFGCVQLLRKRGYYKVYSQMSAQCFMLLNPTFWKYVVHIQVQRWNGLLDRYRYSNCVIAGLGICLTFIPYILYCVLELSVAVLYYGFPIVNFTHTFLRAYYMKVSGSSKKGKMIRVTRIILACVVSAFAIFIIYMFSIIFVESFLFLARMAIYTYTGMFARPEECYGYVVFGIMVLYYLWESVNKIGSVYQMLLNDIILISQCLQSETNGTDRTYIYYIDDILGIPEELFEYVVERHRPRMKELFVSALKVIIIIILILFSVQILLTFNSVEKLYLLTHIFQAIFICMVPKLLTSCCSRSDKQIQQKYYMRELRETIEDFWRKLENVAPNSLAAFQHSGISSDSQFDDDPGIHVFQNVDRINSEEDIHHVSHRLAEINV